MAVPEHINEAVEAAKEAYRDAPKDPFGHGFARIEGIDGRTKLARKLKEHPDVSTSSLRGFEVRIDGVNRYLEAQRKAYRAFLDTLEEAGVETQDARVRGRLD